MARTSASSGSADGVRCASFIRRSIDQGVVHLVYT